MHLKKEKAPGQGRPLEDDCSPLKSEPTENSAAEPQPQPLSSSTAYTRKACGLEPIGISAARVVALSATEMARKGRGFAREAFHRRWDAPGFQDKTPAEVRQAREEAEARSKQAAKALLKLGAL